MLRKVVPIREGGKSIYRIRCRCGATGDVVNNAPSSGHIPFETLKRRFAAMGWRLGLKPTQDRCIACQIGQCKRGVGRTVRVDDTDPEFDMLMKHLVNMPLVPEVDKSVLQYLHEEALLEGKRCVGDIFADKAHYAIDMEEKDETMADNVTTLHADAPREMKRSDRQVIFNKLQDVYPKEDVGYAEGWDDDRVAKDLGVPRAWVTTIREENFGPIVDEAAKARAVEVQAHKAFRDEAELRFRRLAVAADSARAALDGLAGAVEHLRAHLFEGKPAPKRKAGA